MKLCRRLLAFGALLLAALPLPAAERIPPAPPRYFNDYAGVVSRPVADQLNVRLEQFERDSSNQLLVVIYPKMESASSVEDYTVRVAQAWRAGQASKSNGAVLFSFMQEHQLYLQVGYGLEGVLPDATAKRIIEQEIVPRFRTGDIDGGMSAAVEAMIAATKGEYKGTGRTVADSSSRGPSGNWLFWLLLLGFLGFKWFQWRRNPAVTFLNPRRRTSTWIDWGGGSGGGWSGGSGGGGFSGGGGSFGGGGAGGKW